MARGKRIRLTLVALCLSLVAAALGTADSHRTNAQYIAWKFGWNPEYADGMRYFGIDTDFRESLVGRPVGELRGYFPELQPASSWAVQDGYLTLRSSAAQLLCIGHSGWYVEVEDGLVRSIELRKG